MPKYIIHFVLNVKISCVDGANCPENIGRCSNAAFVKKKYFEVQLLKLLARNFITSTLDAVGLSQIFFPTQNLERAYNVDEESEAVF